MARLTLLTLAALLSIVATAGCVLALNMRGRTLARPPHGAQQLHTRDCPMFELLMQ